MRRTGVTSRGIRLPILKAGDDLENIVVDSVLLAAKDECFEIHDKDVIAITESIVARCQNNYASVDDIAKDVKRLTGGETVGVIFPILSRNRFSIMLKGIARGAKKVVILLSYPRDEVGNALLTDDQIYESGVNPYTDILSVEEYHKYFGKTVHEFTGVDYVEFYTNLVKSEGAEVEIIFANRAEAILNYTDTVIAADIHTRNNSLRILKNKGAKVAISLADILAEKSSEHGYNQKYGLLGSNKSTEEKIKLFPRDGEELVANIQQKIKKLTGKNVEVMVYGDGAFKDPQGKIWELADPVVSPFHTEGLKGTPNELKLKYLADDKYANLSGDNLKQEIIADIKAKKTNLVGDMASQGTTPRQITDLLGSLADLTSGSGDKGTPVILIQGYFDNYSNE